MSAAALSAELRRTVGFLQSLDPHARLRRYDDWCERDGLHFYRSTLDFHSLFGMVKSPRALLSTTPGDEDVFVGVSCKGRSWYLRFRVRWNEFGFELSGRFDVTVPHALAERFKTEVAGQTRIGVREQDADSYYRSIM